MTKKKIVKKNDKIKQPNKIYITIINIALIVAIILGVIVLFDFIWTIAKSNITR